MSRWDILTNLYNALTSTILSLVVLSFVFSPIPVSAAESDYPVPGQGIRVETPDDTNPDKAMFSCTDEGWSKAPYVSYRTSSPESMNALQAVGFLGLTALQVGIVCWKILGFLPILAAPACVAASAYVSFRANQHYENTLRQIRNSDSYDAKAMFSTKEFPETKVLDRVEKGEGIDWGFCVTIVIELCTPILSFQIQVYPVFKTINKSNQDNFVGIYMSLIGANKENGYTAWPVSNSAHSLCHMIRCANQAGGSNSSGNSVNPSCQIFDGILAGRFDAKYIQDLKNYIGLTKLNRQKYIASKMLEPTPFLSHSQHNGVSGEVIDIMSQNISPELDKQMVERYYLNRITQRNQKIILADRIGSKCSMMENRYCSPLTLNFTDRYIDPITNKLEEEVKKFKLYYPKDFLASSLFRDSVYVSGYDNYIAHSVMNNLISMTPLPLNENEQIFERGENDLKSLVFKDGGDAHMMAKFQMMAHLSNSNQSIKESFMERMPWAVNADPKINPVAVSSELSVMESEAKRRLFDQKWYEMMSVAGEENVSREIVIMMAQQLQTRFKMARHFERIELLLGSNIGLVQNRLLSNEAKGE